MKAPDLTLILPSPNNTVRITIAGERRVLYVPRQKYEALRAELGARELYIAYEDGASVIIAGYAKNGEPRLMKMPRAQLYGDVRALLRFIPVFA